MLKIQKNEFENNVKITLEHFTECAITRFYDNDQVFFRVQSLTFSCRINNLKFSDELNTIYYGSFCFGVENALDFKKLKKILTTPKGFSL